MSKIKTMEDAAKEINRLQAVCHTQFTDHVDLLAKVSAHNKEMESFCDDGKYCSNYKPPRTCPTCTKNWLIEAS